MTEEDWSSCSDPQQMVNFLQTRGQPSLRKVRLFTCACVRLAFPRLPDKRSRHLFAMAERHADGLVSREERSELWASARWAAQVAGRREDATEGILWILARLLDDEATLPGLAVWHTPYIGGLPIEGPRQCHLLRDLLGPLPFRPVRLSTAWLTAAVLHLAARIYEQRSFEMMAVLADALEESGCDNREVISHLREQGRVHFRGCWCVDLLLNIG